MIPRDNQRGGIVGLRHVGIVVANLESALAFWCDTLGFRVQRQMLESGPFIDALLGMSGVEVTTSKLIGVDGNMVELLHFHSHPDLPNWQGKPSSTGLTHLAFTVSNLDALYVRLSEAGVKFFGAPQISPDGGAKVVYASGPENLLLEFVEVLSS